MKKLLYVLSETRERDKEVNRQTDNIYSMYVCNS